MRQPQDGVGRWRTFAAIFLVYLAYPIAGLLQNQGPWRQLAGFALIAVFVWLYLFILPGRGFSRLVVAGLALVQTTFVLTIDANGFALGTYVGVALVMSMPRRASVPLVLGLAAVTVFVPSHISSYDIRGQSWALGGPILLVALAMYGVRAKADSDTRLGAAEDEIAHLAAEQERLRIARDLHDLLGHSLTTISVKAELASRLVALDPNRAAREMSEVAVLAREGLADVRATVGGYRSVSLVTELAAAREVLFAAGIAAELPPSTETVPGELRELFGWVVREGVTNAVRHSGARRLRVSVAPRSIEVSDDGVGCASAPIGGNGLTGLRERVASVGGEVSVAGGSSGFSLKVTVPA